MVYDEKSNESWGGGPFLGEMLFVPIVSMDIRRACAGFPLHIMRKTVKRGENPVTEKNPGNLQILPKHRENTGGIENTIVI